jgi:hypothetical protein
MNPQAMRQAIRTRINTLLIVPHPEIEWILREDFGRTPVPSTDHVIIDILPARSRQAATGSPRLFRTRGVLVFRISTPLTDGAGRNEEIAALISPNFLALLDNGVTPPVRYFTPNWAPSEVPDETWFVARLAVDWEVDVSAA